MKGSLWLWEKRNLDRTWRCGTRRQSVRKVMAKTRAMRLWRKNRKERAHSSISFLCGGEQKTPGSRVLLLWWLWNYQAVPGSAVQTGLESASFLFLILHPGIIAPQQYQLMDALLMYLLSAYVMYICACVCTYMCVRVCVCVYICMCKAFVLYHFHLMFWDSVSLSLELTDYTGQLWASTCPHLPCANVIDTCHHIQILHEFWGSKLWFSILAQQALYWLSHLLSPLLVFSHT